MNIGYSRVSTDEQDTALQRDALTAAGCSKIFEEVISSGKAHRPQFGAPSAVLYGTRASGRLKRCGQALGGELLHQ